MISKTHRRDVVLGDIYERCSNEYHVRLFADANSEGRTHWVDFQIFEIIGYDSDGERRKFFNKRDSPHSPDAVYSYDEAEIIAEGFVKWDGCTQFDIASVHVDDREQLAALFAAISKARELAAEEMPGMEIGDEYR